VLSEKTLYLDGLSSFQGSLTDTLPIKAGDLLTLFHLHLEPTATCNGARIAEIDSLSHTLSVYHSEDFPLTFIVL